MCLYNIFLLFSRSFLSSSLQPYGLQRAGLLCPPLSPGVCSNSCLLKFIELVMLFNHLFLCHPHLLLPSVFIGIGSFSVSHLFESGGRSTGASAATSDLLINIQSWFLFFFLYLNDFSLDCFPFLLVLFIFLFYINTVLFWLLLFYVVFQFFFF